MGIWCLPSRGGNRAPVGGHSRPKPQLVCRFTDFFVSHFPPWEYLVLSWVLKRGLIKELASWLYQSIYPSPQKVIRSLFQPYTWKGTQLTMNKQFFQWAGTIIKLALRRRRVWLGGRPQEHHSSTCLFTWLLHPLSICTDFLLSAYLWLVSPFHATTFYFMETTLWDSLESESNWTS